MLSALCTFFVRPSDAVKTFNRHVSLVQEAQAGLAKVNSNAGLIGGSRNNNNHNTAATSTTTVHPLREEGKGPAEIQPVFPDPGPSPSPPPRPTPAPAQVSVESRRESSLASHGRFSGPTAEAKVGGTTAAASRGGAERGAENENEDEKEMEMEMERLVEWRDELLATGMYTSQNPIVGELNRRIALATGRHDSRPLQREE